MSGHTRSEFNRQDAKDAKEGREARDIDKRSGRRKMYSLAFFATWRLNHISLNKFVYISRAI